MDTPEHNDKDVGGILRDTFTSQPEPPLPGGNQPELVRTSRLAVVACVLGVASLLLFPGLIVVLRRGMPPLIRGLYPLTIWAVTLSALTLGLVSLIRIALSNGRLTGRGFAWMAVMASVGQYLLFRLVEKIRGFRRAPMRRKPFPGKHYRRLGHACILNSMTSAAILSAEPIGQRLKLGQPGGNLGLWGPERFCRDKTR